jgi:membrane protein
MTSAYGAAGTLVLVLPWVYYAALVIFFGAELTQVRASTYGAGVKPTENAQVLGEGPSPQPGVQTPPPPRKAKEAR